MGLQCLAGAALGLILGLLVGLSSSPVVATVVGAVTSGMLVLLGFGGAANKSANVDHKTTEWRLIGFGFSCSIALFVGMFVRTHDLLSRPLNEQISNLTSSGFTSDEAHAWVAYKNVGILVRLPSTAIVDKQGTAASTAASYLFATGSDPCGLFRAEQYSSQSEQLNALSNAGALYAKFATAVAALKPDVRSAVMSSTKLLFCP